MLMQSSLPYQFWSESASIYPYFVDVDSKGSAESRSAYLQGLPEPSFLDTAMSTSINSKCAGSFDLFFVTGYNLLA